MELFVLIALAVGLGHWVYSQGKQDGSRGGFRAGWQKSKNFWQRRRR